MFPSFDASWLSRSVKGFGGYAPYGTLNLTNSSPAQSFIETLSIAEIKSYLRIPDRSPVDTEEDLLIGSFIIAAREQAEIMQGRDLIQKQFDLSLDYWPGWQIELRAPLVSVDLLRYRDSDGNYTTLTEDTDYIVDSAKHPGIVRPAFNTTWPTYTAWPSSSLLVRFTSGLSSSDPFWSNAGQRVLNGMRLLISWWYNNRIPFENATVLSEYPFQVTQCMSYGSLIHVG